MAKVYSMRRAAYRAVRSWADRGWRVETSISKVRESQGLEARDIAASSDIANTAIKRLASLNVVLSAYCSRPRGKVEAELWTLAQIGLAQLLFRTDIPQHAAVHETVLVADEIGKPQWKGFLNGLLRAIARDLTFQKQVSFVEGLRCVASQSTSDDERAWAVLGKPIVDGGPSDPEWLSRVYSFPRWLLRRWLDAEWANGNGENGKIERFLRASNQQTQQWIRVNLQHGSREQFITRLQFVLGDDVQCAVGTVPEAVSLSNSIPLASLPGFSEGSCSIQDLTAMKAVETLSPVEGERILDLCAAPGGKTGHIAERLAGSGYVCAADISESRLQRVQENIDRLKLTNAEPLLIDRDGSGLPSEPFDAALVDVPCSNTGVLSKRPEVRWRIQEEDLVELPKVQLQLLERAAAAVRACGRVVYSTCSVEREENRGVVDQFLKRHPEWSVTSDSLSLPGDGSDGGYHALFTHDASQQNC